MVQPPQLAAARGQPRFTKSHRANLVFPVTRIHKKLQRATRKTIRTNASVYLSGVLEYLTSEILDFAGLESEAARMKRINPRHLLFTIRKDEEISQLLDRVSIPHSGVVPNLNPALLPKGYKTKVDEKKNEREAYPTKGSNGEGSESGSNTEGKDPSEATEGRSEDTQGLALSS
ncbi:unnamed protein product [Bursaphelenchus xylophilus]|uniref:Histone H2A n=1 Tax=Bursaphelenchus xylophilus TaxID=6326 RepID=A0A811KXM4_BURXY|nr:unnamed protein product [Bursaphelenchus xylophilus]CAG9105848.1 unnamed protein product [Bursaphelenchus xylophilus]